MTGKSIVFLNRVAPPQNGATGRLMHEAITALRADGWQASALSVATEHNRMRDYLWSFLSLFRQMTRLPKTDILVFMTDPPFLIWLVLLWPFSHKTKLVHWCHDLYPDLLPQMGYRFPAFFLHIAQRLSVMAMNRCNSIIAIGHCMKDRLIRNGADADRIVVIPNWAPLELHALPYTPHATLQILYAGNFGLNHSLDCLLQAAAHFKDNPSLKFVFSGQGKKRAALQDLIRQKNLHNCEVKDFVPSILLNDLLNQYDIHVTVMNDEALGLLVPCKIYSAPAVKRFSLFIGPDTSEASLFLRQYQLGAVLPGNAEAVITWLEATLADPDALHRQIADLKEPPSTLPAFTAFLERLHHV